MNLEELKKQSYFENIIIIIKNTIKYEDSLNWFLNFSNFEEFCEKIQNLPITEYFEILKLISKIHKESNFFQISSLEPQIEQFWYSHSLSTQEIPKTSMERFYPEINNEIINLIIKSLNNWVIQDNQIILKNFIFKYFKLILLSNSFINNGNCWLFCPIKEIRELYIYIEKELINLNLPFIYKDINNKLKSFNIYKFEQISQFINNKFIFNNIDIFFIEQISLFLNEINNYISKNYFPPIFKQPNLWEKTIGDGIIEQMSIPISQRVAYYMTNSKMTARLGGDSEDAFDDFSLPDLLFTNGNQEIMLLPYINNFSIINKYKYNDFIENSFKKFIANELINLNYNNITESIITILTDVLKNKIKKISEISKENYLNNKKSLNESIKMSIK